MLHQRSHLTTRPAAAILGGCAVLSVLVIMHHPVVRSHQIGSVLSGMSRLGALDRAVHAVLIVFMLMMLYAFAVYAYAYRGRLLLGVAALAVFAIGCGAVAGAGLIDGFFFPAFAARFSTAPPDVQRAAIPVLTAAALAIQILTKFGFLAYPVAGVLWAIELTQTARSTRIAGAVAGAAALAQIVLVASSGTLNPQNLTVLALIQAVWCLIFASRLWNGERYAATEDAF